MLRVGHHTVVQVIYPQLCVIHDPHLELFLILFTLGGLQTQFEIFIVKGLSQFLLDTRVEEEQQEVETGNSLLLESDLLFEEELKKVLLDLLELADGFDDEESKVGILLGLAFPVLEGLNITFLVHILTALPEFLIVDDVDVGALISVVLHLASVILEPPQDEFLVGLLLEAEGQQGHFLIVEEVFDIATGSFPLALINGLKDDSLLGVGNVDLVLELPLLHPFEDCHIADGCSQ